MAAKKAAQKAGTPSKATKKAAAPRSMPKEGRNPKGGLTQAGRDFFAKRDGLQLKPGVTGAADTPEKMRRKGSFLVRTFTHPRGPMVDPKGQPTRLALSAHAWGEKVPKAISEAHKLAAKGHQLLSKYHALQERNTAAKPKKNASSKAAANKAAGNKAAGKTTVKKSVAKKSSAKSVGKGK